MRSRLIPIRRYDSALRGSLLERGFLGSSLGQDSLLAARSRFREEIQVALGLADETLQEVALDLPEQRLGCLEAKAAVELIDPVEILGQKSEVSHSLEDAVGLIEEAVCLFELTCSELLQRTVECICSCVELAGFVSLKHVRSGSCSSGQLVASWLQYFVIKY